VVSPSVTGEESDSKDPRTGQKSLLKDGDFNKKKSSKMRVGFLSPNKGGSPTLPQNARI
jgi:hypothetical protein